MTLKRATNTVMRIQRGILVALLGGAMLAGCSDLNVTNPNQQNSQSAWGQADALNALAATYNAMLELGVFGRWQAFNNDIRSDIGTARTSPWGDLANYNAFQLANYNFDLNHDTWANNYDLIGRANVVIARAPTATMDTTLRNQYIGEAKFLRALAYYNLVTLYDNVPLLLEPQGATARPGQATPAETYAQIEKDLTEAAAAMADDPPSGHANKWAALAMLGRVRLQEAGVLAMPAKWSEASTALSQVIASGHFTLEPDYATLFTQAGDDKPYPRESIFEVENEDMYPIGVTGLSFPKMIGICYRPGAPLPEYDPTYCDGRPTRWYFDQFLASKTVTNGIDPRMEATLIWKEPAKDSEPIFNHKRGEYFVNNPDPNSPGARADTMIFFKKYGEYYINADQRWDNPINYKVLRYGDVLLMQAEALNQSGQTPAAFPFINQVRARANKAPLAGLSQAQLRDTILYERMLELGLESSRFNDLRRYGLLTPALVAHDADFANFQAGKSERLPLPTTETNLNPNVQQNPGW